jgi:hypothetical protein
MKKAILALAAFGLLSTPVVAQVNQGQGGAPSEKSGGVRPGAEKKMHKDEMKKGTTGSSSTQNPANGNAGKSGGEGGSGR